MIRDAAAYLRFSRTPRTAGAGGNRVSVNPLSRAAGDATYKATKDSTGNGKQGKVRPVCELASSRHAAKQVQHAHTIVWCRSEQDGEAAVEAKGGTAERLRVIHLDSSAQKAQKAQKPAQEFVSNKVVTSKYNIITFLPIFLFEMFSRVAYLYFLLQVWGGSAASSKHRPPKPQLQPNYAGLLPAVVTQKLLLPAGGPVLVERHIPFQRLRVHRCAGVCAGCGRREGCVGRCEATPGGQAHEHQHHPSSQ